MLQYGRVEAEIVCKRLPSRGAKTGKPLAVANRVEEGMIEAGSRTGYLTTARLSPLATAVLRLTVSGRPGG